ncbi:unnamed protein product [Pylaiella littoralis]
MMHNNKIMRSSFRGDTCGVLGCCLAAAVAAALLSAVPGGEAFLCPAAVQQQGVPSSRGTWTAGMAQKQRLSATGRERIGCLSAGDGEGVPAVPSRDENASREGPFRRARAFIGRKAATAAAVSTLVSAGAPGPAEALFGRGKAPEMPSVPAIQQRLEDAGEELTETAEGMFEEAGEVAGEALSEMSEAADALETPTEAEWEGEGEGEGTSMASAVDAATGADKAAVAAKAEGRAVSTIDMAKDMILENKEVAAVVLVGVAGSRYMLLKAGGKPGRSRGGRRRRGGKGGGAAPKSPYAGIGQPRVSPEVAAADLKKKTDSLKNVNFDVDVDLFGDAVSDLPARPPPPPPPAPEPSPSPSEAMKGVRPSSLFFPATFLPSDVFAVEARAATAGSTESAIETAAEPATTAATPEPSPVTVAETPAPSTSYSKKPEKSGKRKGAPILNLFKRDAGPQRATTLEEALTAENSDEAVFRQALAAVLARSAPAGEFNVKEPEPLLDAVVAPENDLEGEEGEKAASASRIAALNTLMEAAGLSLKEGADVVADVVNAMVVGLTDAAVTSRSDESMATASDALLQYMDEAGALFVALCPGIALDPQIKYNGTYKRGKLEKVFEAAAKNTLKTMGDEGQMVSLDRLQDLFSIKKAKADSITQKIMMDLMMKMMSEGGGEGGDAEGLEKMMAAMGGAEGMGGMGGMPGMGAGRTPEDHKREVEALKAMVDSGECPKEEVDALRKMYSDAGMDIDTLVNDPMMESSMDSDAKEVVVLLRKLLALWPKK